MATEDRHNADFSLGGLAAGLGVVPDQSHGAMLGDTASRFRDDGIAAREEMIGMLEGEDLVEAVRQHSQMFAATWVHMPYLALAAEGRVGVSGDPRLAFAYYEGLWPILETKTGGYAGFVDLRNGDLLGLIFSGDDVDESTPESRTRAFLEPLSDQRVAQLATDLSLLNAVSLVAEWNALAQMPYPSDDVDNDWKIGTALHLERVIFPFDSKPFAYPEDLT